MNMTGFEKIKSMNLEEMSLTIGCPEDFDGGFEVPEGCTVFHPTNTTPISCIKCIKNYLNSEVKE